MTTTLLPPGLTPYKAPPVHKPHPKFGRPGPVRVGLIGAGGCGSEMLVRLVEMDHAFASLGLPRLDVTVYDPDTVSSANPGRQRFYKADVGLHKAVLLVHRANAAYGLRWAAVPEAYTGQPAAPTREGGDSRPFDILITCVDTARARREIHRACTSEGAGRAAYEHSQYWDNGGAPGYWLDLGNGLSNGQVVLGQFETPPGLTVPKARRVDRLPHMTRLPHIIDLWPGEYAPDADAADEAEPSCTLAQSLSRQDLFINKAIALKAADLLWRLLRDREIDCQGWWVNLREGDQPMPIEPARVVRHESLKESA
jgi:PRTRC genetic system ThiF family protein